jgi:lysophospholipase L1-like esterase
VSDLRVVIIGDSTTFTDDVGPQPPDAPHLWPNLMRDRLTQTLRAADDPREVILSVWARPGVDALEAWQALTKDRHLMFELVGPSDVVVIAIGSLDHAPAGLPPILESIVPRLRPTRLRRAVRRFVRGTHPHVVRLRGARGLRTPARVFEARYRQVLVQAQGLTLGRAACVALGPTSHRARHHGGQHPRRAESEARHLAIAASQGFTTVPIWSAIAPFADRLNPDGVHWPAEAHAAVARDVADGVMRALAQQATRQS